MWVWLLRAVKHPHVLKALAVGATAIVTIVAEQLVGALSHFTTGRARKGKKS